MAWSTRELAELAGTTVKAVRHYHQLGLLDEPERRSNGYKSYTVAHLVRLLRIRRLTDLGVPLAQVAEMGDAAEHPEEALRSLDAEVAATIDRLQRVRAELAMLLEEGLPTDLPPELAAVVGDLSDADRAMMVVYGRVFSASGIEALGRMLTDYRRTPVEVELDELPPDADEETRRDLAERFLPAIARTVAEHPDIVAAHVAEAPGGAAQAARTIGVALAELYNPAQLDVLDRAGRMFREQVRDDGA